MLRKIVDSPDQAVFGQFVLSASVATATFGIIGFVTKYAQGKFLHDLNLQTATSLTAFALTFTAHRLLSYENKIAAVPGLSRHLPQEGSP